MSVTECCGVPDEFVNERFTKVEYIGNCGLCLGAIRAKASRCYEESGTYILGMILYRVFWNGERAPS